MALKSHKIALRPTDAHRLWFAQQCGYARFAYNNAFSDFKAGLSDDVFRSEIDLNNRWNQRKHEHDWVKAQDQRAGLYAIKNLGAAIENWKEKRAGFPKFKRRGCRQSYTTDEQSVKIEGNRIKIPKLGWVRMFQELRFAGKIKRVTISRTAHRWFVSILVETGKPNAPRETRGLPVIGVDVGINTLATLDDGTKYHNPRPLKRYERKLAREQRKLSKKVFGSNNWYKQKRKVERIHYRITCIREHEHHNTTTQILKKASVIGIETLKLTNLLKNRNLAKALSDSALGGFLEKLKSKAEVAGIPIVQASQFFASSKTCSNCGEKKADLLLSQRQYTCESCGFTEDRDVNAAMNLKKLAVGHSES